jgi:hypothetical protein
MSLPSFERCCFELPLIVAHDFNDGFLEGTSFVRNLPGEKSKFDTTCTTVLSHELPANLNSFTIHTFRTREKCKKFARAGPRRVTAMETLAKSHNHFEFWTAGQIFFNTALQLQLRANAS